ncbi:hypothetical protein GlitD10_2819 [Gloeomargarita lithophora Alchichica-D10]|uniref:DUF4340 domain-containing protein n=1 Tax=Gloeomargarita lithophora Alchichica-D10 TaxID=1188229 RepID=A0A1J0AGZ9_9CYAN|nr:DUF4340 domain-containing protein [Gloeomargarita lithophora]APB35163.1 hypothetical protein GlitD10_2819 [Gloeomargarita lithophora Alchichica-D10]
MKLSPNTLIILGLAIGLTGGIGYWELVGKPQREERQIQQAKLFNFAEKDVTAITIIKPKLTLKFQRVKLGQWQMVEPQKKPANDAPIAFLLGQLTNVERVQENDITIPAQDKAKFGLAVPSATIQVTLENGSQHRLILGNTDFSGTALYAEIDPPAEATSLPIALVPIDLQNAVNRDVKEWQAPAQKAEPKPSPTPKP